MRRFSVFIGAVLLILLCATYWLHVNEKSSPPDWGRVAGSKKGVLYIDPRSIKKVRGNIQLRALSEIPETEDDPPASVISIEEIDCDGKRARTLSYVAYPGPMGAGKPLVSVSEAEDWIKADPQTTQAAMINLVCDTMTLLERRLKDKQQRATY